jgi:threonylcarbamoyladenosine tRNA methylthiotransferase MtaB
MSKVDIVTFGCRLNSYESEVMRGHAQAAGLDDIVIINTCAVTGEAVRQARQTIRKTRRERPDSRIIVTGCAAQLDAAAFAAMPEVDRVLGNEEKLQAQSFLSDRDSEARVQVGDIMAVREVAAHLVDGFDGRARAFVQVQQGCDHRCTFCIIPFARGNSRSVPVGPIVEQVRSLVANGYGEVVLTGVDITAWGADLPGQPTLGQLVRRLLIQVPELPRLRLSSIDAVEIDPTLERLLAEEERVMPHLHLSLQAGDDIILKRMKRRHSRGNAIALTARLRRLRPDMVFGADLIAGFPTETDEMFENSLRLIDDCGLTYLHVFPYSPRPDTPAARMPQVPGPLRRERAARLREKGDARLAAFLQSRIGGRARVLVEKPSLGRTEHFAETVVAGEFGPGAIVDVDITGTAEGRLIGRMAA